MSQYEVLDHAILARIGQGVKRLGRLQGGDVYRESYRLAELTGRDQYRVLDARLQALRKAGLIRYESKVGWLLPKSTEAAS